MAKNRYHRHINLSEYIPQVDFTQWNTDNIRWHQFHQELQPEQLGNDKIMPWLDSLNMTTNFIEVFCTPPKDRGIIHSDNNIGEDWSKLIFQYGAKGSRMRWWSSDNVIHASTGMFHEYFGNIAIGIDNQCTKEYEVELSAANLINIGPLHSSFNPTNEKRFVVTIALCHRDNLKRVLWDDAVEILKDFIQE